MMEDPNQHLQTHFSVSAEELRGLKNLLLESSQGFETFLKQNTVAITRSTKNGSHVDVFQENGLVNAISRMRKDPPAPSSETLEINSSNPLIQAITKSGGYDETVVDTIVQLEGQISKAIKPNGVVDYLEDNYAVEGCYWITEEDEDAEEGGQGDSNGRFFGETSFPKESPLLSIFHRWSAVTSSPYCQLSSSAMKITKLTFEKDLQPLRKGNCKSLSELLLRSTHTRDNNRKNHKETFQAITDSQSAALSSLAPSAYARKYLEIEEEEDWLEENGHLFPDLKAVHSWDELYWNYNLNDDPIAQSWFLQKVDEKKQEWEKSQTKKKRKSNPLLEEKDWTSDIHQPIPVSYHHPAAWNQGIKRPTLDDLANDKTLFETIHPAFFSTSSRFSSRPHSADFQSADLLTLALHSLQQTHNATEASNYTQLCSLLRRIERENLVEHQCRKRRKLVNDYLYRTYRFNEPKQSGRLIYPRSSLGNSKSPRTSVDVAARYQTRTSSRLSAIDDTVQLGACVDKHIPFADYTRTLRVGDATDVRINRCWFVGLVISAKDDQINRRLLKVKVFSKGKLSSGNVHWVAVETGNFAPVGTFTKLQNERSKTQEERPSFSHREQPAIPENEKIVVKQEPNPVTNGTSFTKKSESQNGFKILPIPAPFTVTPFYSSTSTVFPRVPIALPVALSLPADNRDPRVFISQRNPADIALVGQNANRIYSHNHSLLNPISLQPPAPLPETVARTTSAETLSYKLPLSQATFRILPGGSIKKNI